MYNKDLPNRAELPSTARLIHSTVIALVSAFVLLVTVVLPAEYAIDPTGAGRLLGLTEMGEIKQQLAEEALLEDQADAQIVPDPASQMVTETPLEAAIVPPANETPAADPDVWKDEITVVLAPGEAAEVKLYMDNGMVAEFIWTAAPGHLNSTLHGNGTAGEKVTYRNGRAETERTGELTAKFDGRHGWFWRNRSDENVTLTLKVKGAYNQMKRVL